MFLHEASAFTSVISSAFKNESSDFFGRGGWGVIGSSFTLINKLISKGMKGRVKSAYCVGDSVSEVVISEYGDIYNLSTRYFDRKVSCFDYSL